MIVSRKRIISLRGGLGNQLFQVAFACSASDYFAGSVLLDVGSYRHDKNREIEVDPETLELQTVRLPTAIRRLVSRTGIGLTSEIEPHETPEFSKMRQLSVGYYQNLATAESAPNRFKRYLSAQVKESPIVEPYVAVHLRLGDYALPQNSRVFGVSNPQWVLEEAINLAREIAVKTIIICTDDINSASAYVSQAPIGVEVVSGDSPWNALRILTHGKGLVMANSTLSWWAAFCNWDILALKSPVVFPTPWRSGPSRFDEVLPHPEWRQTPRKLLLDKKPLQPRSN